MPRQVQPTGKVSRRKGGSWNIRVRVSVRGREGGFGSPERRLCVQVVHGRGLGLLIATQWRLLSITQKDTQRKIIQASEDTKIRGNTGTGEVVAHRQEDRITGDSQRETPWDQQGKWEAG